MSLKKEVTHVPDIFEPPKSFARRVGLPERLVRVMVRQGQLPHVKTGKCHVLIHVEAAMDALRNRAEQTAEEIAATLPVPIRFAAPRPQKQKKHPGRPPDSVRLKRQTIQCAAERR